MADKSYVVVAPYVTPKVKDASGGYIHRGLYAGGVVRGEDIEPGSLAHHLEGGMMAPVDAPVPAPVVVEPVKPELKAKAK